MRNPEFDGIWHAILRAAPLTAVLALAACGGGGGGGGGGGNGNGGDDGGDSLTELNSLSGVPANDNWLFYTSNAEGNAGLFAFNPLEPDNGAELVDADAYLNANPYVFSAISSGDVTGTDISNYRARYLFYRSKEEVDLGGTPLTQPNGLQRVSAGQSVQPDTPTQVSSEADATNLLFTRAFFQNDLDTPGNTAFAYRADDSWRQVRVGDTGSQVPDEFDADHRVVVSLGDGAPNGWLVIDESTNNQLAMVDMDLTDHGYVPDHNGDPVDGLTQVDMFVNLGLDAQLVVLTFEDPDPSDDEAPDPELWLYTLGEPGTMEPLLNGQGEKLTFSRNMFGAGASLPPADKLVVRDDAVYFAHPANAALLFATGPQLYRVDQNGWSVEVSHESSSGSIADTVPASPFLIDAGDRLIWRIGTEMRGIDTSSNFAESTLYEADSEASTPILDSQGGWFFYNDDDTAVAARTDGSERIQLRNASWIGASSRGEGPIAYRLAKSQISEVFLLHDDGTLVAVSAAEPDAGGVVLGQLDPTPEAVRMFGIRSGPHQLMQVHYGGDTDTYEVIYVDSREPGSLRHLMTAPTDTAGAGSLTRPVYGQ